MRICNLEVNSGHVSGQETMGVINMVDRSVTGDRIVNLICYLALLVLEHLILGHGGHICCHYEVK